MPLKIGKSKSSSGSELIHTNSCPDDSGTTHTKKNRGFRRIFDRTKCSSSKTSSPDSSSVTKSPQCSNNKLSEGSSHPNSNLSESSSKAQLPVVSCHSVSPKLYANSCASSIEELSKVAMGPNGITPGVSSSAIPCSPIQDVILEEDYEEALLLMNKTQTSLSNESDLNIKDSTAQSSSVSSVKFSQGIYNEPKDTAKGVNKEIIETCRLSQITPTNQFKEIRSRSGSDTDPLIVHPDLGVGGRCSTNSSSVGSALTLSESPAVAPQSCSPQNQSVILQSLPTVPTAVPPTTIALSINVHTTLQTSSGPPTLYTNSPKGNTVICHHPSSPFAPPTSSKPNSSSNPSSCMGSATNHSPNSECLSASPKVIIESPDRKLSDSNKNLSSNSSIVSRRPGRFSKSTPNETHPPSNKQTPESNSSQDVQQSSKHSERRSEYYSKHPVYEEAWDLKLRRMCKDMADQSGKSSQIGIERMQDNYSAVNSGLPSVPSNIINSFNRPQSAAGARCRTDSPSSKYTSPPAVPPHRRNSVHYKLSHGISFEDPKLFNEQLNVNSQTSQSINDCRTSNFSNDDSMGRILPLKPNLKHSINPSFDDQGLTTDYDYAYNETWSLGVQYNMAFNLTNNDSIINGALANKKDPFSTTNSLTAGYMDKIDSVDSEESSSLSTSQEASNNCLKERTTNIVEDKKNNMEEELVSIINAISYDNDSLSNDSYEEPWDVRHGRVISELTSARLIDPACVLPVHEQSMPSAPRGAVPSPPVHHKVSSCSHNRNINRHQNDSKSHNSSVSSNNHSKRQRSVSASRRLGASCSGSTGAIIDRSISLEDQPWYHEDCTRQRAEQLLNGAKEGSFLVRKSETSRNDFSLTIKHNNDFLHMKISKNSRGFILGQYSQPYITIPHMLHHYSLTMVPVKGADAVLLKNPITR